MFKEFMVVLVAALVTYLLLNKLMKKKKIFITILNGSIMFCIGISLIYNIQNIFPNYNYEDISIGDCTENLFIYKSDSQFKWQILFPLLQNRIVQVYDINKTYAKFMELYSQEAQTLELDKEISRKIEDQEVWSLSEIELSMFLELDYVFPEYYFDDTKGFPKLYIEYQDLHENNKMIAYVDEKDNLYLMSKKYFESIR